MFSIFISTTEVHLSLKPAIGAKMYRPNFVCMLNR